MKGAKEATEKDGGGRRRVDCVVRISSYVRHCGYTKTLADNKGPI